MSLKTLDVFLDIAKSRPRKKVVVAAAEDEPVLEAVTNAKKEGIVDPILIGNVSKIKELAKSLNLDINGIEMVEENSIIESCRKAVQCIRNGEAQILMKGLVPTADFLRAVLNKETGLRKNELLSHIGFFDPPKYHKVIALTDCAQNIAPTLQEKLAIIHNSVELFHRLGVECPKIACLGSVEVVNPKMEATMDAAIIAKMNQRKQIKGCLIDGPLAFDNAISEEAAHHKGIESEVAGDPDMCLVHNIDIGNVLYKSLTYLAGASVAAMVLGAAAPIVLTSRADSDRSKLVSIALAASF